MAETRRTESESQIVHIARCPEHGLHGERAECFVCGEPVEQVPMVPVGSWSTGVYVASGVKSDDVRQWYEVPSNVVDRLRETIDPGETFVECLVRLLAERQGTYRQVVAENRRLKARADD